jgi:hypothetical protein
LASPSRRVALTATASALTLLLALSAIGPSPAETTSTRIEGTVVAQSTGLPIANATVNLIHNEAPGGSARTDSDGRYHFDHQPAGSYSVSISAAGYQPTRTDAFFVVSGQSLVNVATAVPKASTASASLHEIGRVTAASSRASLQTTTVIHSDLDTQLLQAENNIRVGDALNTLPGVNLDSQSSAIGDDIYADIRGIGANETQVLLDGHPIGPIGASPTTFFNGVPSTFDFQDSPTMALRNVAVTYGSGALGLYGTDSIGGVVDLQTIDPTRTPAASFTQGIGNYGRMQSSLQFTGTAGRVGYAVVSGVTGTYGNFAPQLVTQSGLLGNDLTSTNRALNTYTVSQNYLLRNDLLKLRYAFSPGTSLTLTGYSGISWDDKSGNGDNDFITYDLQLYNAQQAAAGGPTQVTGRNGSTFTCPNGHNGNPIAVITDAAPNGTCLSASQYAAAASGPGGGGPSPWQAIRNQDYHARLLTQLGKNQITLDGFADSYAVDYNRNVAGGPCYADTTNCNKLFPGARFLIGGFDTGFTRSRGFLASDDIASATNDFGFGFFSENQKLTQTVYDNTNAFVLTSRPELDVTVNNFFIRDAYTPQSKLSFFFNGWAKHSSVTSQTRIDPRLSVVYKPTSRDVFRLTGGASTEAPAPALKEAVTVLNTTPQNINPNCNGLTEIGTSGNPHITAETGSDVEFAYGHSFKDDSTVQVDVYSTNLSQAIFNSEIPASSVPGFVIPPGLLSQYFSRIKSLCANLQNPTLSSISYAAPANAASARFRGVELRGRYRVNPRVYLDYMYDIQSAFRLGVPDSILQSNFTIVNGAQVVGIPLHKASLGIDYADRRGFEARMDGFYIGPNNSLNRPPYYFANATVSKAFKRTVLNLGFYNVFNNASDIYGRQYIGTFAGENRFGTDTNSFQQGSERFGLPPPQVQLSVTQRI